MSYRDDHAAAVARIDALAHETAVLTADNARLTSELAEAREWLGGARKRLALGAMLVVACASVAVGGFFLGRWGTEPARAAQPTPPPLPIVLGGIVADGPTLGHWTLDATRCVAKDDGVLLTTVGSDEHNLWLTTSGSIEIETPGRDVVVTAEDCRARRRVSVWRHLVAPARPDGTPTPMFDGAVDLNCVLVDGTSLQGAVEFRNCQ